MISHKEAMINENRERKAMDWLCGFLRAKYGNTIQVVQSEAGIRLVAKDFDSGVDLEALVKSLPVEIVASIGAISTGQPR